jgi:hypothetical protein
MTFLFFFCSLFYEMCQVQDKQLDGVEQAARKLQVMGLDMGEELDESTANIQALGRHTDAVGAKISTANERVVRLLK